MSEWVYSTDAAIRRRQEKVVGWLRSATGYTGPGSTPTLGTMTHNILFLGPVGTGKDRLCSWLVRVALSEGKIVRRFSGPEMYSKARGYIESGTEEEFIDHLVECDVLFISDPLPPGGTLTAYQASLLYRVIDDRWRMHRPIWVTINVGQKEAPERLTPQVWDRLKSGATLLYCDWKSFRRPTTVIGAEEQ